MKRVWVLLVLVTFMGFAGAANAELYTIGTASYDSDNDGTAEPYNLIYEGQLGGSGLVWMDYTTRSVNSWFGQVNWAAGLNGAGVLTYNLDPGVSVTWGPDWRLPSAGNNPQVGADQTSEMGHLYYTSLGKLAGGPLGNTYPFANLQADYYWSGTEYLVPGPGLPIAWGFDFSVGDQSKAVALSGRFALAVRPGEVSAVPEPATVLLLGSGVVALAGFRRRFKK